MGLRGVREPEWMAKLLLPSRLTLGGRGGTKGGRDCDNYQLLHTLKSVL